MKVAIIGAGISGLTVARTLSGEHHDVTVFEKEAVSGGLIRCRRIDGSLFHLCGGHVFNSKRQNVLDWFWSVFNRDTEFSKTGRNSVIIMGDGQHIPYPIENHVYRFNEQTQRAFINDLISLSKIQRQPECFEDFLRWRFGETLYNLYFRPYNEKIWRSDLKKVPLTWLEGKLPMPTVEEMIFNNINRVEEKTFVHSTFYYEKHGGSQYIADKLSQGVDIRHNTEAEQIQVRNRNKIEINGEVFDLAVFCGNIRQIPSLLKGIKLDDEMCASINQLEYHGTTTVFCEIEKNPYSWIYLPNSEYRSHRIICTGNFSPSNNGEGKMTGTVEFTDYVSEEEIRSNLSRMPLSPRYIAHHYNKYAYPIQDSDTRCMIQQLKRQLAQYNIYFTGRFADWEYYNMDVAIDAAFHTCRLIKEKHD